MDSLFLCYSTLSSLTSDEEESEDVCTVDGTAWKP